MQCVQWQPRVAPATGPAAILPVRPLGPPRGARPWAADVSQLQCCGSPAKFMAAACMGLHISRCLPKLRRQRVSLRSSVTAERAPLVHMPPPPPRHKWPTASCAAVRPCSRPGAVCRHQPRLWGTTLALGDAPTRCAGMTWGTLREPLVTRQLPTHRKAPPAAPSSSFNVRLPSLTPLAAAAAAASAAAASGAAARRDMTLIYGHQQQQLRYPHGYNAAPATTA